VRTAYQHIQTVGQIGSLRVVGLIVLGRVAFVVHRGGSSWILAPLWRQSSGSTSYGVTTRLPRYGIHRCFERVNQLLSLLVPVSDINRAAVGGGGAWRHCFCQRYNSLLL